MSSVSDVEVYMNLGTWVEVEVELRVWSNLIIFLILELNNIFVLKIYLVYINNNLKFIY